MYGIESSTFAAEFSINAISNALSRVKEKGFTPIAKYPPFEFDFAVIVDQQVSAGKLMTAIRSNAGKTLQT